jgi:hypothetical protein
MTYRINGIEVHDKDKAIADELISLASEEFRNSVRRALLEAQLAIRTLRPGESKTFKTAPFKIKIENTEDKGAQA